MSAVAAFSLHAERHRAAKFEAGWKQATCKNKSNPKIDSGRLSAVDLPFGTLEVAALQPQNSSIRSHQQCRAQDNSDELHEASVGIGENYLATRVSQYALIGPAPVSLSAVHVLCRSLNGDGRWTRAGSVARS